MRINESVELSCILVGGFGVGLRVGISRVVLVLVRCSFRDVSQFARALSGASRSREAEAEGGPLTSHHGVGTGVDPPQDNEAGGVERDHRLGCAGREHVCLRQ